MSNDRPEGVTTGNNNAATSLSSDDPVVGQHMQPDDQASSPAVEQPDVAPADGDLGPLVEDEDTGQGPDHGLDVSNPVGEALFSTQDAENLRRQWTDAQTAFVDNPRVAVERADHLVVETIRTLSTSFNQQRSRLEEQWVRGDGVSTEDLRVALRLYRAFFDRLLSL